MSEDTWARRDYTKYAGPVAEAYGWCRAETAVIIGPTGGGKTTESARRVLRAAQWQDRSPRDGERKCRIGVIAPTYRRLWDQVMASYRKEINPAWKLKDGSGGFTGSKGDPADHHFHLGCPDGTIARVEVLFRAVGDADLEDFFRGLEVTAFWFPEMDTHANGDILSFGQNRVGRYPEPEDRPEPEPGRDPAYAGVWGDANAPEIDDWFYNRFWLPAGRQKGDRVFIQSGGFSATAENMQNLRRIRPDYYANMAAKLEAWAVRRFVENRPGYSRHGQPVHDMFDVATHAVETPLKADPGQTLVIGADCGNTLFPAAAFLQRVLGQVRQLGEVNTAGRGAAGMDLVEFAGEVRRMRETTFGHVADAVLVVDPSAAMRSVLNRQTTLAAILQAETGLEVLLAPSNDPLARRSALDQVLKRGASIPGEPGFVVSALDCPETVKALSGGYHFAKRGQKTAPTPAKVHPFCDIAEATQYGVLAMEGLGAAVAGLNREAQAAAHSEDPRPILQE